MASCPCHVAMDTKGFLNAARDGDDDAPEKREGVGFVLLAREELLEDAEDGVQQAVADDDGRADGEVRAEEPRERLRANRPRESRGGRVEAFLDESRASSFVIAVVSAESGDGDRRRRARSLTPMRALDESPRSEASRVSKQSSCARESAGTFPRRSQRTGVRIGGRSVW